MMRDIRAYIDFLERNDGLKTIEGADWDIEMGGLTELMLHEHPSPRSLLFDDIKDFDKGQRVLTNALATPLHFTGASGYEPTMDKQEAILAQKERSKLTEIDMHPPKEVSSGPVLENVLRGKEVDVTKFPAPKWHEKDGGQYIGTGDAIITKHAETSELNVGTYRVQVHGPETVTVYMTPGKDGRINEQSYLEKDKPFPIAISLGHPVDLFIAATDRTPAGLNELEYLGGIRDEPIEVIEDEVTGLPVPAHSEIVLMGHVYPDSTPVAEGPFGEYPGYYVSSSEEEENSLLPVTVEKIWHRDNPINLGAPPIRPPSEVRPEIRNSARLWNELEEAGLSGIEQVYSFPFSPQWCKAISINQQYAGHSVQVGMHAASGAAHGSYGRFTIVVDDDLNVFDQNEVFWAVMTRCDPPKDIHIVENCRATSLDPILTPEKRKNGDFTTCRVIIDATRPYHWRDQFPEVIGASDERKAELRDEWGDILFDDRSESSTEIRSVD